MSSSVASVLFILYTTLGERRFEIRARKIVPCERRIAAIGEHCCKASGSGIVGKRRLANAVERVAEGTREVVVEALDRVRSCDADNRFVGHCAEVVIEECRHDFCPQRKLSNKIFLQMALAMQVNKAKYLRDTFAVEE